MKTKIAFTVPVQGGKAQLNQTQLEMVQSFLAKLDGKTVALEWAKPKNTRSLKQNAFLWGVAYTYIAQETGNSTEDVHTVMKDMFLPRRFIKMGPKETEIRKTTTDLTPTEFAQYLEAVMAWGRTELGINFPDAP